MMICNVCQGTGFCNIEQLPEGVAEDSHDVILKWIDDNETHDVAVCHCCGDGDEWYGEPGQHYGNDDPIGQDGPYASNGGLCLCH